MGKINITGYKCERCGHTWAPRSKLNQNPKVCPKCKSPYWDLPRRIIDDPVTDRLIESISAPFLDRLKLGTDRQQVNKSGG